VDDLSNAKKEENFLPKKADFKGISSGYIKQIIEKLNNRPRKKNRFSKPIDLIKHKIV